ncbi:MAG: hypothetical protein Q9187_000568 [Circinaria calcarea]
MAPQPKRTTTTAEVALVQLRNCLVNLPPSVVAILVNANTAAQNVVIEIQSCAPASLAREHYPKSSDQSTYVGWTGMPSHPGLKAPGRRNGPKGSSTREQDSGVVEIDSTFARMIGLVEGQKLNLLSQIRALPNPSYSASPSAQARPAHPLTLHLSPTSTANIIVGSLTPPLPSTSPFAKLAPDAEVIVAPRIRARLSGNGRTDSRSVASTGRRSAGGKSGVVITDYTHSHKSEPPLRQPIFLRGLDRGIYIDCFDSEDPSTANTGLTVWVDRDVLSSKSLKDVECVCVSVVQPAALKAPIDPQQHRKQKDQVNADVGGYASKIVAKLRAWDDAPDSRHATLSSLLCAVLGVEGLVGGIVRLEAAPAPVSKSSIKNLKIYPFAPLGTSQSEALKFGGETKANREAATERIKAIYGYDDGVHGGMLNGPLTNGLVLPKFIGPVIEQSWNGGLLRFDSLGPSEVEDPAVVWLTGLEASTSIQIQQDIPDPYAIRRMGAVDTESLPPKAPVLVGIDKLVEKLVSNLSHQSSVLLNGGLGSGKSAIARLLAIRLRSRSLYHTTYLSCRKLVTNETRISAIKEIFNRIFMTASWGSRSGGRAIVILDDLDKLCPAETELQVGGENGRSRQVSEMLCSMAHQYCSAESNVVLLITAQSKDALNSIIIGAHVVRDIVDIKAPGKHIRQQVLQSIAYQSFQSFLPQSTTTEKAGISTLNGPDDEIPWLDGPPSYSRGNPSSRREGFARSPDLDFLEIAGRTDGYMPSDLGLLVSRARSEALVRRIQHYSPDLAGESPMIELCQKDFERALKGFTPASLRNVSLQTSSTTFDSIGGLQATRKILLETLQYPTTYAPIFAQCPLRLRSGLLLYGFPGCGKTLLASAVAGECGLNFISVKGPEILNKYIGASEKSVRDLFDRAEAARPCILFFDEFDSIAPKRGHDSTGVTDRVVNQLLTQMDGAEGLSGVYVLAATSRPDLIDPALLRPGRLDKSLICDLPDGNDRLEILKALSKRLKVSPDVINLTRPERNFTEVARRTEGYSGADLQAVIYNAHLEAIHNVLGDQKGSISMDSPRHQEEKALTDRTKPRELIQFRFGEEEDVAERASSGINHSKQIADHAELIAKLDLIKASKRKERQARRYQASPVLGADNEGMDRDVEVVIQWKHIEASLATTRRSISTEERRKLQRVYTEFTIGRNGEMPNGQASVDVGGRSSLM